MDRTLNVLVVGGGIAGMSAAITLTRVGARVQLVDLDPEWRVYGAGITITGPTLRAMKRLGLYDEVAQTAYVGHGIRVCDADGGWLHDVPTPIAPDAGVAGCGGIMRPALHRMLSSRVLAAGVDVRLGVTVDAWADEGDAARVRFSDGRAGRFDLVVGADGLFSRLRGLMFPDAPQPRYMGQSVWRTVAPRPPGLDQRHFFLGGPHKVGLTPVAPDRMYLFLLETRETNRIVPDAEAGATLARLLAPYGGPLRAVREQLEAGGPTVVVRPLEALRLPAPWSIGCTQLIGDSAHPTTPQLASGAGLAIEDAIVLAEEVAAAPDVPEALRRFMARRHARCRLVVDSSFEIGEKERAGAPAAEQTAVLARSLAALAEDI